MGRLEENIVMQPMTAQEVARYLLAWCGSLTDFQPFMFGSSLAGVGSDFDILVVGPSGEPLTRLKAELEIAGRELPLDVIYMLPEEAQETNFVSKARCITLKQLAISAPTPMEAG